MAGLLCYVLGWILYIDWWIVSPIIGIISVILWIVLMLKVYQGERWKVPVAGDFAEKNMHMVG
ncbi:MAG: Chloroplast import component protein (Tic20) [Candidatus Methanolliviera sp. GoM_asphalt]|nr:MAG: Chloroplast import component protein (Tic20) [Candidatus Methanolliviera sp. GoM_asphalt]